MAGQHRLDRAGGQPVAGDVDHVVGAAHHEQIAVLVAVAAVAGEVVAGEGRQIAVDEALIVAPDVGSVPGGSGSLITIAPSRRPAARLPPRRGPGRRSRAPAPWASRA